MLSVVKMLLKGEVRGHALNSHGNYIVDFGKSWKNHGIVFLNFSGNPGMCTICLVCLFHAIPFTPLIETKCSHVKVCLFLCLPVHEGI